MLEYPHGVFQLSAPGGLGPRCAKWFQEELQFGIIYGVAGLVDWRRHTDY